MKKKSITVTWICYILAIFAVGFCESKNLVSNQLFWEMLVIVCFIEIKFYNQFEKKKDEL